MLGQRRAHRQQPGAVTWSSASESFLRRDVSVGTRRVYRLTLDHVGQQVGAERPLDEISGEELVEALQVAYGHLSPASWNRVVATVRSFYGYASRRGWVDEDVSRGFERRRVVEDHGKALSHAELERLLTSRTASLRDRALWRLLYETAARAHEVLQLNVEDVDLERRRAHTVRKGGDRDVMHFQSGAVRLLPKVIAGRTSGPLFLAEGVPAASRVPALSDLDPSSGRARLSYRRAAEVFKAASGGRTLHQLRHTALTRLAEDAVPLPLLLAKSRHAGLRSLQHYARPGEEAVARLTAEHDPARRRPR